MKWDRMIAPLSPISLPKILYFVDPCAFVIITCDHRLQTSITAPSSLWVSQWKTFDGRSRRCSILISSVTSILNCHSQFSNPCHIWVIVTSSSSSLARSLIMMSLILSLSGSNALLTCGLARSVEKLLTCLFLNLLQLAHVIFVRNNFKLSLNVSQSVSHFFDIQ